jgi:carboxymethylenebutenolidase
MNRAHLSWILASLVSMGFALARADDASGPKLPASDKTTPDALKASPRHGEWVDIDLPGSKTKLHSWVVYPERKGKAPVVLVIHEIFGLTDWARAVTDQLAAEGYIAVAPDMISGMAPNGGGSEETGTNAGRVISKLNLDEDTIRLNAARDYALALPGASDKSATIGFCWGGGARLLRRR